MVVSTPSSGDMTISTSSLTDTATTTNTEEGYDWSTITAQAAVYEGRKAPEIPQPPQPQQQPHHQSPHPHAAHPQVAHPQPHLDRLHRMPGASSPITQATHFHAALTLPRHFAQSQNPAALSPNPVPHSLAPQTPGALALTPTDVNLPTYFSSAPSPANPPPPLRDSKSQTLPRLTRNTSSAPLLSTSQKYLAKYPPHPMITKEYIMGEELGVGGFGFVVAGERRDRGGPVAVKFIFRVSTRPRLRA